MRSFLAPALFSSSCRAAGQEAIHFPLAHTHSRLEPSHGHFAEGAQDGWGGLALASSFLCSWGGFQQPGAARRVSGSSKATGKGRGAARRAGTFCSPAKRILWLPLLLLREGLSSAGEH